MRFVRTTIIAGIAAATLAGAAIAAREEGKLMLVALPDGSVQHIRVDGDTAPQVLLVRQPSPADIFQIAFGPSSPLAEMDRMAAAMEARGQAMMRQAAMMHAQSPATGAGQGIVMTNAAGQPVGVMQYSYVSSTTTADGCTQTVSYSSNGGTADQPMVIRTSAGNCGAGQAAPKASPVTLTSAPAAKPTPKIIPVSAPKAPTIFTPSRT